MTENELYKVPENELYTPIKLSQEPSSAPLIFADCDNKGTIKIEPNLDVFVSGKLTTDSRVIADALLVWFRTYRPSEGQTVNTAITRERKNRRDNK